MGDILDELNDIIDKQNFIIAEVATELYNELRKITPVDTENLKGGWTIREIKDGWLIENPVVYAEIRLSPSIIGTNGKLIQGSLQNPAGIEPTIEKFDRILTRRLKAIK